MHLHITQDWQKASTDIFWGEIAPTDHVVQIYENDKAFLEALTGFVGGGINSGDVVVVIATDDHLKALEKTLSSLGIHVKNLIADNRYIPLNAEKTLQKFMVNGWPDEELFNKTVSGILSIAKQENRRVRAFGEMVAILWSKGMNGATVHLEHLWNKFCAKEEFSLFCAYPKAGFTGDMKDSVENICCAHNKVINGVVPSMTEVLYQIA